MPKKPLNKIRIPFLEASFSENPLPYKRLNRKGIKVSFLSNKKGVTNKINRIQKKIIEHRTLNTRFNNRPSVERIPSSDETFNNYTVDSFINKGFLRKKIQKTYQNFVSNASHLEENINVTSNTPLHPKHPKHLTDLTSQSDVSSPICKPKKVLEGMAGMSGMFGSIKSDLSAKNSRNRSVYIKSTKKQDQKLSITKYTFSLEHLKAELYKKQSKHNKLSSFKKVLLERKKCSLIYGSLGKKGIQKLILQAKHSHGKFDENFIKIVESRLDVALYRICFFPTIFSAKQWINHGHVLVNKKVNTLPGYQLKAGDVISISSEKKEILKKKISFYIAKKLKIRESHSFIKINNFYTVVKNLVKYQNKNFSLSYNPINISLKSVRLGTHHIASNTEKAKTSNTYKSSICNKGSVKSDVLSSICNQGSVRSLVYDKEQKKDFYQRCKNLHFQESRQLVLFFKKSFHHLLKSLHRNKIYASLYELPQVYPFSSFFLYQKVKERVKMASNTDKRIEKRQQKRGSLDPITSQTKPRFVWDEEPQGKIMTPPKAVLGGDEKTRDAKIFSIFYPFLKVKNLFTSARPFTQRDKRYKISGMKPLNLEVCYKNMVAIFLYSPQKVALPATLDLPLIGKNV